MEIVKQVGAEILKWEYGNAGMSPNVIKMIKQVGGFKMVKDGTSVSQSGGYNGKAVKSAQYIKTVKMEV